MWSLKVESERLVARSLQLDNSLFFHGKLLSETLDLRCIIRGFLAKVAVLDLRELLLLQSTVKFLAKPLDF